MFEILHGLPPKLLNTGAIDSSSYPSSIRVPAPGSASERQCMAAAQPDFLAAYKAGFVAAHNATCKSGDGNDSHTAVKHWGKFCLHGLRINMLRPLDATTTTLVQKLGELDLVEAFAWWLVTQVKCNTETAWNYVCVMNYWHNRATGAHIAAGFPLLRVKSG